MKLDSTFQARHTGASRLALLALAVAGSAYAATPGTGNPDGNCAVPTAAQADSIANARVVGTGSPSSCTSAAFVNAVAQGGAIKFNCGPDPVTITLTQTAKVFNNKPNVVIDGGGKVTLSGAGVRRILYMNTCDPKQVWTTDHCDTQDTPRLTVQNITLTKGNSKGQTYGLSEVYGGGAIYARGGRLKVVNTRFFRNTCETTGPDLGGAAIRAYGASPTAPVYITRSTFGGGSYYGNSCSNGGAISGLATNFSIYNSLISYNTAVGNGANPAAPGTPGGGSGGGIYQDGNTINLTMCGNKIQHNHANEGGGASFFVSNNRTGTMSITNSTLIDNPNDKFETNGLPGIFILAKAGQPVITNSQIKP
ncbi:MAG TPA: hypothetical protein VFY73_15150 [Ideonella sp.]|uniref:hypothetical protein n=1 Tax=Ideonella sp. TaxID=1929293 RepID=UPI002E36C015|nr:hypothetical protein [Ideonella sp.]HEX5685359.1 hypothetical protein [Ideonella sp.]